jgi:uncharacterized membrane protein YqaE (UPF0057 family)
MDSPNIYITLVLIGITIIAVKKINIFQQEVEHFGNPLEIIQKIGKGMMDFFLSLLDIFLVIGDVFSWIALLPFLLLDLILLLITWLWPITMIKGIVSSIFTIVKILLLGVIDFIIHIARMFFAKIFGYLKGGLWGIPHTPMEHHSHTASIYGTTGHPRFERTDEYGDHHHHYSNRDKNLIDAWEQGKKNSGNEDSVVDENYTPEQQHAWEEGKSGGEKPYPKDIKYRPLRCYRGISNNGFINIAATIICPPLGVFMAFGLKAYMRIFLCCVLSLAYYIPGLVYALLVTTHLGLGRTITAKDCGGIANYGLRIAGCTGIKTEEDCNDSKIPGWRDQNDGEIPSCRWVKDENKCFNIIYPSGIHTIGSTNREAGEIGGRMDLIIGDDAIDQSEELADDKKLPLQPDKIDYSPMGMAKGRDKRDRNTAEGYERIQLSEHPGPWKYMGND